jgi:hypothetical protein
MKQAMKHITISITYRLAFLALVVALVTPSCSKKFLDQTPPSAVPASSAITDEPSMYTALLGAYSSLRATDFYGRTYAVKGDLMSDDSYLSSSNSGRYLGFNQYDMDKTNSYPSAVWQNAYAGIKNANFIINSGVAASTDNLNQMFSEAYALRGLILFDLLRNFSMPYASGGNGPGVPIVLKFDQTAKPGRSTIAAGYTQVLADLNKALSMAKFDQGASMKFAATGQSRIMNSSFITKYTIEGLLARVYQHMGDWANAKAMALDVAQNSGFSMVASTALVGYWAGTSPRSDKVETMFEVTSDANNSVSDGTLANLYVPKPVGSYGDILATQTLYNSYTATDARIKLYNPSTRTGQLGTAYYVTKYPIDVVNYDDVKIVRYAEVLLILAEAYHNTGDDVNALKYLNMVAMRRDPAYAGYTSTGAQVLEDILNEREKEMAFEGYRFWDLYRLQRSFVKPQAQDATNTIIKSITVTPGTTRNFIFPIPSDEALVNPGIGQNTGY